MLGDATAGPTGSTARKALIVVALAVGAALVAATSAIHLDVWAGGYRNIPTIGPLFLFQGIAGAAVALALLGYRRLITVVAAAVLGVGHRKIADR